MPANLQQADRLIRALEVTHNTTEFLREWPVVDKELRAELDSACEETLELFTSVASRVGGILIKTTSVTGSPSNMLVVAAVMLNERFIYSCIEQGSNNAPDHLSGPPSDLRSRFLAAQLEYPNA